MKDQKPKEQLEAKIQGEKDMSAPMPDLPQETSKKHDGSIADFHFTINHYGGRGHAKGGYSSGGGYQP